MNYDAPSHKSPECAQRREDTLISSHTHTHTHTNTHTLTLTLQIHALLVMGWYNEKKTMDQYAKEKRGAFIFDLKEESEDECLTVFVTPFTNICVHKATSLVTSV